MTFNKLSGFLLLLIGVVGFILSVAGLLLIPSEIDKINFDPALDAIVQDVKLASEATRSGANSVEDANNFLGHASDKMYSAADKINVGIPYPSFSLSKLLEIKYIYPLQNTADELNGFGNELESTSKELKSTSKSMHELSIQLKRTSDEVEKVRVQMNDLLELLKLGIVGILIWSALVHLVLGFAGIAMLQI
jgi:hypothetical protein